MILIVDDHTDTCRALSRLLKRKGIDAEYVDDPEAAIATAEALAPDLLILDQMMPGLRGTDLLRSLRQIRSLADVPVIFYSAADEGRDEAKLLGALMWLQKGRTDWVDLLEAITSTYEASRPADDEPPARR